MSDLLSSRYTTYPYIRTDGLYNLEERSRTDQLDILEPNGTRHLLTSERSEEAEELLRNAMGDQAVLPYSGRTVEGFHDYAVPRGALPLVNVLRSAPYSEAYMQTLTQRAQEFLQRLHSLDRDSFGVTIEKLAFTQAVPSDTGEDYNTISIIPPITVVEKD